MEDVSEEVYDIASDLYNEVDFRLNRNGAIEKFDVSDYSYEEYNEYYRDCTEKEFNDAKKYLEKLLDGVKYYEDKLELSDNHTIWDIDFPEGVEFNFDEYSIYYDQALQNLEDEIGTEVYGLGRSGRHICVDDTFSNLVNYKKWQEVQEKWENWLVKEIEGIYSNEELNESEHRGSELTPEEEKALYEKIVNYLESNELYAEVDTDERGVVYVYIDWGDWKHDHLRCDALLKELGYDLYREEVTDEDGSDAYSATRIYVPMKSNRGKKKTENKKTGRYEEIKSKYVIDTDGFTTDYTMYYDTKYKTYVCIYGDKEIYTPENTSPDWEEPDEKVANMWFNAYDGFADNLEENKKVTEANNYYMTIQARLAECDKEKDIMTVISRMGDKNLARELFDKYRELKRNPSNLLDDIVYGLVKYLDTKMTSSKDVKTESKRSNKQLDYKLDGFKGVTISVLDKKNGIDTEEYMNFDSMEFGIDEYEFEDSMIDGIKDILTDIYGYTDDYYDDRFTTDEITEMAEDITQDVLQLYDDLPEENIDKENGYADLDESKKLEAKDYSAFTPTNKVLSGNKGLSEKEIDEMRWALPDLFKDMTDEQKQIWEELSLRGMVMSCLIYGEDIHTSTNINAVSKYYHQPYVNEYYDTLGKEVTEEIIKQQTEYFKKGKVIHNTRN